MTTEVAQDRLPGLLAERPHWHRDDRGLRRTLTVARRSTAMALLDDIRDRAPGHGDARLQAELRGADLSILVRSPGHVGVTDDDLRLAHEIDLAALTHLGHDRVV